MAGWNGSGVFTLPYNWEADQAAGINIEADRMDGQFAEISVQGFGNTLTRDGQGQPTANLPMAGFRHTGAGAGVDGNDYAIIAQLTSGTFNSTFATVTTTGVMTIGQPGTISAQAVRLGQFPATTGSPGTMTFPNGVIEKWGTGGTTSGSTSITFGLAFPTACDNVQITIAFGTTTVSLHPLLVGTPTASGFAVWGASGESIGFYWRALGH